MSNNHKSEHDFSKSDDVKTITPKLPTAGDKCYIHSYHKRDLNGTLCTVLEYREGHDEFVCNICYEETLGTEDAPRDTSLMCSSGHAVCFACIRKLMEPKMRKCSASCCSMVYTCPYCRQCCCIGTVNLAALAANSHSFSYAKFCCGGCLERWSELTCDPDADSDTDSS